MSPPLHVHNDPSSAVAVLPALPDRSEHPLPDPPRWQRITKHRLCSHYNRLIVIVLTVNGVVALTATIDTDLATDAVLANFLLAVLIRQRKVVNSIFVASTSLPRRAPLRLRQLCAKVYHVGGIHVGAALAAVLWYFALVVELSHHAPWRTDGLVLTNLLLAYAVLVVLVTIALCAMPVIRARRHNVFELSHRFGGWSVLALLWAQTLVIALIAGRGEFAAAELLALNQFWVLLVTTACVAEPWTRLRREPVTVDTPSSHIGILQFTARDRLVHGSGSAISLNPLREWHSFTALATSEQRPARLFISRAGDWTGRFIDDPPASVWVKGGPTHTFKDVERLFGKMLFVATGSGIGPAMTAFKFRQQPGALVWVTRSPRATYGDAVVDEILTTLPEAIVVDTKLSGKPDMVQLCWDAVRRFDAEAVLCVANPEVTWAVVSGLESRGVPAIGPIWDS